MTPLTSNLLERIRRARMAVFDFDGTLVDSNPIKQRAFAECFAEFPQQLEDILRYCHGHHHTPRGDKFRDVYERILKRPYTPEVDAALHERFEAVTTQQIIDAPEIPGATAWLQWVSDRRPTALLSSTPQSVLEHLVEQRGWAPYFTTIQGAPVDKAAWLSEERRCRSLESQAAIFFGDTIEDAQSAREAQWVFIGVGSSFNGADGIERIDDFTEVVRCL